MSRTQRAANFLLPLPVWGKRHCLCPTMWCDLTNWPWHVVASSLHDVTLARRHSTFCYCVIFVVDCFVGAGSWAADLFLSVADSIDIFSACWGYVFCLFDACSIIVFRKPFVLLEFGNDRQTECSSVCTNTNSSDDSCFCFSCPFHLIPFHSALHSTSEIRQPAICSIFDLVHLFRCSIYRRFCWDRSSRSDLVSLVSCSRPRRWPNLWPGAAA